MAQGPLHDEIDLPSFTILVDGSEIKEFYEVETVEIDRRVNKVPFARVVLVDGSPEESTFEISETTDFVPGNTVTIKLGYHLKETQAFEGIITSHNLSVKSRGGSIRSVLEIHCHDKAVSMTTVRKSRLFTDMTDQDILNKILGDYSVDKSVDSTTVTNKKVVQYDSTDWDFLVMRAEVNGMGVFCEDGKVNVKKIELSGSEGLVLNYGTDIFEFDGQMDARTQLQSVSCSSWDYLKQEMVDGQSQEPSGSGPGDLDGKKLSPVAHPTATTISTNSAEDSSSLKNWASAALLKSRASRIRGTVSCPGNTMVTTGGYIKLEGFGSRFNGVALVAGVKHHMAAGGWRSTYRLGWDPEWFYTKAPVQPTPAKGLLPATDGLMIGKVKQIDEDPDGDYRVRVDVPIIDEGGDGIWARLTSPYSSDGCGHYFFPEIDDEVVLGFLNEDPRFPVILGSLYSKARKPKYTPDSDNYTKSIYTKAELEIKFDDEKKVISLLTPGGNSIVIDDDSKAIKISDLNSNSVTLDSSGITLDSASDIVLNAKSGIELKAMSGISIQSTGGDVELTGTNVNANANVSFQAQGSASSTLKSTGQVVVQGSIVQIN